MSRRKDEISLREHVVRLAARPEGVAVQEVTGFAAQQVRCACWALVTAGRVFGAKKGKRNVRYFADEAAAARLEREMRRDGDAGRSEGFAAPTNTAKTPTTGGARQMKAWWPADAPMVITEHTRITVAPSPGQPVRTNTYTEWGG